MQERFKSNCILKLTLLFIFSFHLISATAQYGDEPSQKGLSKKKWSPVIHKLSEIGLPESMVKRIRKYTKLDMDSTYAGGEDYHESYAEKGDNDVFEDYLIKVMLRYVGGNIVGFVKKETISQSNRGEYVQTEINIPIEWCAVDSLKQEHCAKTPEEIAELDSVAKPQDWHQKLDPNELAQNKVEDNFDLLRMLDSKKGQKKLKSKKMLDSLISISSNLTGDDSLFAAQKIAKLQKELQIAARKKKGTAALDDITIASITSGLTGSDSINAIKTYVAEQKAQKDKKYTKAEKSLDSTTIASLTQGLTPTDSVKAIRKYLLGAMATKRSKQTRGAFDKSNGVSSFPNDSTVLANNVAPVNIKPSKSDKKKKKGDELDEATLAKVTNGLTGTDSINAIKEYKLLAKSGSSKDKKKKKGQPIEQVLLADSTSQPSQNVATKTNQPNTGSLTSSAPTVVAPTVIPTVVTKPNKNDKKKKKGNDELDDNTIATITKGLTGEDSINAIRDYKLEAKKGKDTKKKKGSAKVEQVISGDPTTLPAPIIPAIKPEQPVSIPQPEQRKRVVDSSVIKENVMRDSLAQINPVIAPPVETKKALEPEKVKEVVPPPIIDNKPTVDSAKQVLIPSAVKDSTGIAPPVVPVKVKSVRKKITAVVPMPTDSTPNTPKVSIDNATNMPKAAIDTIEGNKIVVPADTTKPK